MRKNPQNFTHVQFEIFPAAPTEFNQENRYPIPSTRSSDRDDYGHLDGKRIYHSENVFLADESLEISINQARF